MKLTAARQLGKADGLLSYYREWALQLSRWRSFDAIDAGYLSTRRPLHYQLLEIRNRVSGPARAQLHRSVTRILHPSGKIEPTRLVGCVPSEADALHSSLQLQVKRLLGHYRLMP